MNSACNQTPLDEQSRGLTQFVNGNQQYQFNRLFYGISIGPAAFSAFMSRIFKPLILNKSAITTEDEIFIVLEKYHQKLQNKNMKAALDKSHFFLTRVKFLRHNIKKHYYPTEITNRCNSKTPTSYKQKENPRIFWNVEFLK